MEFANLAPLASPEPYDPHAHLAPPSTTPIRYASSDFVSSIIATATNNHSADFPSAAMVSTFGLNPFSGFASNNATPLPLSSRKNNYLPAQANGRQENLHHTSEQQLNTSSSIIFRPTQPNNPDYDNQSNDENMPPIPQPSPLCTPKETPRNSSSRTEYTPRMPLASRSGNLIVTGMSGSIVKREMKRKDEEIAALKAQLEKVMGGATNNNNDNNNNGMETPVRNELTEVDSEDDLDNECPMCMSPFKKKRGENGENVYERYTVITHCGHRFHLDCLQSTRTYDMTGCPMCRAELPSGITPAKKGKEANNNNNRSAHQPPRYNAPRLVAPVVEEEEEEEENARGAGLFEEIEGGENRRGQRGGRNQASKACAIM
ncbi:hypothetical protein TL16_g00779 [Triparma laevis f. inornata]|uniref:RING-type domain-containing protein n=1 Tax=Triparma laevis f. inornata TaxID=1714386 RepID=A0A9W6ZFQ2_9STRA|nr:hypothetical protein TL16_g00779 [Triparma laevis f. inornata]